MRTFAWRPREDQAILSFVQTTPTHLILVAGATCSGKTTFSSWLAKHIGAEVIALDDFYRDLGDPLLPECGGKPIFDTPEAYKLWELEEALARLSTGHDTDIPIYDISTNKRTDQVRRVKAGSKLIVEGLYALHVSIPAYKIFITACYGARKKRRLARDKATLAGQGISEASILRHFDFVEHISIELIEQQMEAADMLIDTTAERKW